MFEHDVGVRRLDAHGSLATANPRRSRSTRIRRAVRAPGPKQQTVRTSGPALHGPSPSGPAGEPPSPVRGPWPTKRLTRSALLGSSRRWRFARRKKSHDRSSQRGSRGVLLPLPPNPALNAILGRGEIAPREETLIFKEEMARPERFELGVRCRPLSSSNIFENE